MKIKNYKSVNLTIHAWKMEPIKRLKGHFLSKYQQFIKTLAAW